MPMEPALACSVASSRSHDSKKPSMASQNGASPARRSAIPHETMVIPEASEASPPAAVDFEFCVLSSGGLALAGEDAAGLCAADEVFSGGKLLPLRPFSGEASSAALQLLRSDSLDGATSTAASTSSGFSSRSSSRGASYSSSVVSRSASSKSASSDPASALPSKSAASADEIKLPPRRSLSSSMFYAHPSPLPRPPRRSPAPSSAARRSTGSAPPPAAWAGVIRLGVVGAPDVYPRWRVPPAESRKVAAARGAGSQSARFEQQASTGSANKEVPPADDKKLGLGLLGAGLVCSCSPDAVVAPVGLVEAAAAEAKRRRKKAEDKKRAAKQDGKSTSRRSRILDWLLEELSVPKGAKNVV